MTPEPTVGDAVGESEKLPFERHVSPERLCLGLVVFKVVLHFISFVQVCVCMCVYMCACSKAMRKSEDSLHESMLSFHHVGHGDPLWGFRLDCSPSPLPGPFVSETGTHAVWAGFLTLCS